MDLARAYRLRRAATAVVVIVALAGWSVQAEARTMETAGVSSASGTEWRWAQEASEVKSVEVDFVMANVEILPLDGAQIELIVTQPHGPAGSAAIGSTMRLAVISVDGRFRIEDHYPDRPMVVPMVECLPPIGERGAFWNYARPLKVRLLVPRRLPVLGRTMAGSVNDQR